MKEFCCGEVSFHGYGKADRERCLGLFDENCPEYFASNERADFVEFLAENPPDYTVLRVDGSILGCYGFQVDSGTHRGRVTWIMLSAAALGGGYGAIMMKRVLAAAELVNVEFIDISASHLSAPFFAKFSAVARRTTADGWGIGMHRVDMELHIEGCGATGR